MPSTPPNPNSTNAPSGGSVIDGLKQGLVIGAAAAALIIPPMGVATPVRTGPYVAAMPAISFVPGRADFRGEAATPMATRVAQWVASTRDNGPMSFVIVDKKDARIFVFRPDGTLEGSSPVLLGAAAGDDSVAGIGQRPIADVRPEERTTPAGRFIAEPGRNAGGEDVVWVDYDAAVSMHRLRPVAVHERRQERLDSPTPEDNRISYGCINVPPAFFESVLQPVFNGRRGVVYVLPEVKPVDQVFAIADTKSSISRR